MLNIRAEPLETMTVITDACDWDYDAEGDTSGAELTQSAT